MRIAAGLRVEALEGGGARVVACDWPHARVVAFPALVAGVPLLLWSVFGLHWVELGGAVVFCGFGAACLLLAAAHSRDFELHVGLDGISLAGFRGAGRFAKIVAQDLAPPVRLEIRALPTPPGAPELPNAGGDLLLVTEDHEIKLARRTGAGWRDPLESARQALLAALPDLR